MSAPLRPSSLTRVVAAVGRALRRGVGALVTGLLLAGAVACGDDADRTATTTSGPTPTETTTPAVTPGPTGDAFYTPPDPLPDGEPGDLIWADALGSPAGVSVWRILYRSTTVHDEPVAVSGLLAVPDVEAGVELPIVAFATGTVGLADQCAPSRVLGAAGLAMMPSALRGQAIVVATDYEGLGTPGLHPYAVNESAGRNVLDSIRAARSFPRPGHTPDAPAVVWGHSQGGGAALLAAELAPSYAPDLDLRGAMAGAPLDPVQFLDTFGAGAGDRLGYVLMAAAGYAATFPDLDVAALLTPAGVEAMDRARTVCAGEFVPEFAGVDPSDVLVADPTGPGPLRDRLEEHEPGRRTTDVPVHLYHGDADTLIPLSVSQVLLARYCDLGVTAALTTYPGAGHGDVLLPALPDIVGQLQDWIAGAPPRSDC